MTRPTHVLSGTPTVSAGSTPYTYTVTDEDGDFVSLVPDITVMLGVVDTAPTLAVTFLPVQNYLTGTPVNYTLPVASGGNAPYTFTLTRSDGSAVDLPGLTFNAGTNPPTLTGTPTATRSLRGHFYTVHDSDANTADNDRARLSFNIVVRAPAPTPPTRLTLSIDPTMVTESATPTTITATVTFVGGTYTIARIVQVGLQDGTALEGPDFPPLTFTVLTIPANTASGTLMFPFTATADGIAEAGGETAKIFAALRDTSNAGYDGSLALVNANLIINDPPIIDTAPAFAAGASINDQSYLTRLAILPLTLPAVATPGNGATTYTLTPAIAGLTFDAGTRVLSGTPTATAAMADYTYTARDSDPNMATGDEDTLTVSITVVADTAPSFSGTTVDDQTYTVDMVITSLTLPEATGGNGDITYSLTGTLPAGLTFDAGTRVLSGTPTAAAAMADFTYTAQDSDANMATGDEATLTVSITIEAAAIQATGFSLRVIDTADSAAIPSLREGQAARAYRVVATPTPAGSVFAVAQQITFAVAPAPLTPPDSASEPYVPYTPVAPGTMALAVGAASASFTFTMTPGDDELDHADYAVPITATASPSNVTGTITGTNSGLTLLDNDIRITTTLASASVVAGATATYNVQLSEAPPADTTVTVASQGTGTATVSPATLTFSTSSWNTPRTVTVTGVAAGTTTIRHTAPASGDFTFVDNDVAVTVTAAAITTPSSVTLSVNPATVTESADATTITVTATLVGGRFTEERRVTLSAGSASTATAGTDYTPAISQTITIPANATSGSVTIPFTATVDALADSGETVIIQRNLATSGGTAAVDREIPVTPATLTINDAPGTDTTPSFGGAAITAQNYFVNTVITPLTLPAATGGNGAITYTLTGALPAGLTFDAATRVLSGAPTATLATTAYTYVARDGDDNMATGDEATLTFSITITVPDTAPAFSVRIRTQTFIVGEVADLTLPAATGGNGPLIYSIAQRLPDGLTFNGDARPPTITGTPTVPTLTATGQRFFYLVEDSDANEETTDSDSRTFRINIRRAPATDITMTIGDLDGNLITSLNEGTRPMNISMEFETVPSLSGFTADQDVTITVSTPVAGQVGYTGTGRDDFIDADVASAPSGPILLTITDDALSTADAVVTYTATASPSGFTATATLTLLDNDIRITTTPATTSVVAGATATYDVQLGEAPPAATTVSVVSQGAGTATVSPATLSFTTDDWNNAQTVTVTGVAAGSTTIRHTAPDSAGYTFVTNDVDVTVTAAPVAPVFTNADDFTSPIVTPENRATVGGDGFFAATGTGTVTYALTGTDMARFTLSTAGTLTFNDAPDFENPRGMPLGDSNTNTYSVAITARSSAGLTAQSGAITIQVTDVNEAPVVATITPSAFTEYTQGTFDIPVTDVDDGQTLTYALSAPNHGATLTGNTFTWTPGEDDGGVARTFSFTVTDSGTPPMMATGTFDITATELANRAPTGATITAATMLTYPDTISLEATATDPDTGDTLTYSWNAGTEGGSIIDVVGGTATYEPPTLAAGDAARMITITVTVSDSATPPLTTTATHTVTVNPPAPMGTAPAFTNLAMFTTAISVAENTVAAGGPNFFAAPGAGATSLTLDGEDSAVFAITDAGTLTFSDAPNFEMPRGIALSGSNTNDYALTVTAMNAFGSVMSGAITVRVTDVNEAPVLPEITSPTNFVEYSQGTFNIPFSDPDTGDMLTVTLTGETLGATIATDGTFTWTPGEDDGGVARTFTVSVTDSATTPLMATRTFTITATELDNRAPTGATITGGTMVTSPATITLEATAMDADTGTTLTYTWSSDATGDSFDPATGTSTSTVWTPPVLTASDAAVTAVITVTVSDGATPALTDTDTHTVTVNPPAPVDTAPAFTNMAMFGTAIEAAENQTGAGVANFFAAPGTGTVTLTLGGTDMALFTITDEGTLTFSDAPNFEMPRGIAFDASTNTNDYALTVTAMNSVDSVASGAITVRVTDANDAPVLPSFTPTGFTEYSAGTLTLAATDEDLPAQMLTYALTGETRGATITGNVFTWTPGEADGGEARTFTVAITDDGATPMTTNGMFTITAVELLNRAPTGATITADASVTNPTDLPLAAEATDPDTGDMLTYTWSSTATGDSFSPATGASVTWTPPTVTAATMVTLTVTITDTTNGSVTAMQVVTVNPMPVAPVFTNAASFTSPIMAAENQTAVGTAGFFVAPGATAYTLTGTDMERFTISTAGTLTFDDAPNFEMPRGAAPSTPIPTPTRSASPPKATA